MKKLLPLLLLLLPLTAYASILGIQQGGTATSSAPVSQLLYGAGLSRGYQSVATTSVVNGTGISFSANPGALVGGSNLTITNTGLLSLQQLGGGTAQTGAITFSTTTDPFNGLSANELITNIGGAFTFSNNITGTLQVGGGGTGTTSPSGILYGDNGATNHVNTVTIGSNLTFSGGTLSATGSGSSLAYPFTNPSSFGTTTAATTTPIWAQEGLFASSTIIGTAGTVGTPAIQVQGGEGFYQGGVGILSLSNGTSGISWDGTNFYPNSSAAKNLGIASTNVWNHLFATFASTTGNVQFNTTGYPQDFIGPTDTPNGNLEINSVGQGAYTGIGFRNDTGGNNAAALTFDNTDSLAGITHYIVLNNLTGSETCLQITDGATSCLSDYNGLSGLFNVISPAYNASGTEGGFTATLQQLAGNDAVDYGLQAYPGSFPTGIDAYQNYYSTTYAQALPEPHFSFWEQANGNTSEASTSWGFLGATTTISGANATTTSVDIGDLGNTTMFRTLLNPANATFNVISSSTKTTAFTVAKNSNGTLTTDFSVSNTGTASSSNIVISGLGNGSTQCLQINGSGMVTGTGSACGSGGGGAGTGTVATSSLETATQVPFWTTTSGNTALLSGGNPNFTFNNSASRLTVAYASTTALSTTNLAITGIAAATGTFLTTDGAGNVVGTTTPVLGLISGTGTACSVNAISHQGSCSFANQSANTVLVNQSGANGIPTGLATSTFATTLYGVGAAGQVLMSTGGASVPQWVATSTSGGTNFFTNSGASTYLSTGTNLGVGTTTPFGRLSVSSSGQLAANTRLFDIASTTNADLFNVDASGNTHIGINGAICPLGLAGNTAVGLEICGSTSVAGGLVAQIENYANSTTAFSGLNFDNDQSSSALTFAGLFMNSSSYNYTGYGTGLAVPSQLSIEDTQGQIAFVAASTSPNGAYFNWFTLGANTGNEVMRLTSAGNLGIGTTTPKGKLGIQTSTNALDVLTVANAIGSTTASFGTLDSVANVLSIASSTGQVYLRVTQGGPVIFIEGTSTPTLTSCGTSPSILHGGALKFTIQVGSVAATGCTATFPNAPLPYIPTCNVTNQSMSVVNALSYTETTSAVTITQTGLTSAILDVNCTEANTN